MTLAERMEGEGTHDAGRGWPRWKVKRVEVAVPRGRMGGTIRRGAERGRRNTEIGGQSWRSCSMDMGQGIRAERVQGRSTYQVLPNCLIGRTNHAGESQHTASKALEP